MTFREKLKIEHPEKVTPRAIGGCYECPHSYGYESYDDRPCNKDRGFSCIDCWDREIPEEPKTFNFKPEILNALIERAATKKDISVTIFITGDSTHISVYPCPDPSEKRGNPVAEAYKLLVNSSYKTPDIELAIGYLGEALE